MFILQDQTLFCHPGNISLYVIIEIPNLNLILMNSLNWNRFVFSKLWSDRVEIDEEEEWGFE